MGFWRIVFAAPQGTPYAGGVYEMYMSFPANYPEQAPEMRFVTPIMHCNVNCYGKICHSIFNRNWTADTTITSVFECVYGLLLSPDVADPIDTNLTLSFHAGTGVYETTILEHTAAHAMHFTREQLVESLTLDSSSPGAASAPPAEPQPGAQGGLRQRCGQGFTACEKRGTKQCSRCRDIKYCSVACQQADWTRHRVACQSSADTSPSAPAPASDADPAPGK